MLLLSFAEGGFEQRSWHAAAVLFASAAALAVVVRRRVEVNRAQWVVLASVTALAGWTLLSRFWSPAPASASLEAQRTLVYVTAIAAAIAVGGRLAEGTLGAIGAVCAYALGERVVNGAPDPPLPFVGALLHEPLGYPNALGGLAAIGLAGAATALAAGRAPARLAALVLACLALPTLLLSDSRAGLLAATAGTVVGLLLVLGRLRPARTAAAAAGVLLAIGLALPAGSHADELAERAGHRPLYWNVAWEEVREVPLAGRGAGTFEFVWLQRGPETIDVRDAHSLYLETLAELGVVGLALLLVFLLTPLVVALRRPGASALATGAYVAFLVHAGLDWDWEMPAVTVAGVLCGMALAQDRAARDVSIDVPAEGASG